MSSFFYLELDTSSPNIEIYAPSYTTQDSKTMITIESNEPLSDFQEIYIIDSLGDRHDLTFLHDGNKFTGDMYLTNYPLGISTIYARLQDDVGNMSDVVSKPINVIKTSFYNISMSIKNMTVTSNEKKMTSIKNKKTMNATSTIKGGQL